ncbi:MAG: type II toxin-antitoxin system prevent-host-death family antitoxin [Calditrichaceae bacterium]|nr:type II toxin-antitoxin system prevent-host-death family antitoxin [Calditrichia bacterium]NUQ41182.1 type II toxin-antitoxin system prevent-host-death family antitoxin [Calditrichaceae bacterium]
MTTISYTELRDNIEAILKKLSESDEPIKITRKGSTPFVLMSLKDYESLKETLHLLRSPENAERLRRAEEDFQAGKRNYQERELIEE